MFNVLFLVGRVRTTLLESGRRVRRMIRPEPVARPAAILIQP
jgi:hypothetical protein